MSSTWFFSTLMCENFIWSEILNEATKKKQKNEKRFFPYESSGKVGKVWRFFFVYTNFFAANQSWKASSFCIDKRLRLVLWSSEQVDTVVDGLLSSAIEMDSMSILECTLLSVSLSSAHSSLSQPCRSHSHDDCELGVWMPRGVLYSSSSNSISLLSIFFSVSCEMIKTLLLYVHLHCSTLSVVTTWQLDRNIERLSVSECVWCEMLPIGEVSVAVAGHFNLSGNKHICLMISSKLIFGWLKFTASFIRADVDGVLTAPQMTNTSA